MTMAGLHRLELAGGDRLFLLNDRERDAPVVGIRAGRHYALEYFVGQRLVRHDGDLALGDIALADHRADQQRAPARCDMLMGVLRCQTPARREWGRRRQGSPPLPGIPLPRTPCRPWPEGSPAHRRWKCPETARPARRSDPESLQIRARDP